MIRWFREKFKGSLDKKNRKLLRQLQETDWQLRKLTRRRKGIAAQLTIMRTLKFVVGGKR